MPAAVAATLDAVLYRLLADLAASGVTPEACIARAVSGADCEAVLVIWPRGWPPSQDGIANASPTAPAPVYSEMESAILEVLGRGEILTGPQVAEQAGYPYETGIKTTLAALRRRGLIVNRAPGYALPDHG